MLDSSADDGAANACCGRWARSSGWRICAYVDAAALYLGEGDPARYPAIVGGVAEGGVVGVVGRSRGQGSPSYGWGDAGCGGRRV